MIKGSQNEKILKILVDEFLEQFLNLSQEQELKKWFKNIKSLLSMIEELKKKIDYALNKDIIPASLMKDVPDEMVLQDQ